MEALRPLIPVLLGYLLGSIPFGYVLVRLLRGIDVRDYGSHNVGATNVLRVVGWFPALATLILDGLKGVGPVILATTPALVGEPINPWWVSAAATAAMYGHSYSLYFYLKERRFSRGKAVATALGVLIGICATGQVHWYGLLMPLVVWTAALMAPRLWGRWGWVSLSSLLAVASVPITLWALGAPPAYVVFTIGVFIFVGWKHKENMGRLMDGVEPRVGEKPPVVGIEDGEVACAFMIHPITEEDWWQTPRFAWAKPLYNRGLIPKSVFRWIAFRIRPMKNDTITGIETPDGRRLQVHLIGVPWLPEMIKAHPEMAVERAAQAARVAKSLGARVLGLGAFWSVVGNKGQEVQDLVPEIPITNGGAYTAGAIRQGLPLAFAKLREQGKEPAEATVAVVGANGVVGLGICRSVVGQVGRLLMIGTNLERLERSARLLSKRHDAQVEVSDDLAECKRADLIFTATSDPEPVLFPKHLQPGVVIYDVGRPADVDASCFDVPGIRIIPGGIVRPPGEAKGRLDIHYGEGQAPACLGETMLIALDGCYERVSLGDRTSSENIEYFVRRGEELGFEIVDEALAPPQRETVTPAKPRPVSSPAR